VHSNHSHSGPLEVWRMPDSAEDEAQDGQASENAAVSPRGKEMRVHDEGEVGSLQLVVHRALASD